MRLSFTRDRLLYCIELENVRHEIVNAYMQYQYTHYTHVKRLCLFNLMINKIGHTSIQEICVTKSLEMQIIHYSDSLNEDIITH